jgi:hypothetical protein
VSVTRGTCGTNGTAGYHGPEDDTHIPARRTGVREVTKGQSSTRSGLSVLSSSGIEPADAVGTIVANHKYLLPFEIYFARSFERSPDL